MAWKPFRRRGANNAPNPPTNNPPANNPPANAAEDQQGAAANAGNSQGGAAFGSNILKIGKEHKGKIGIFLLLIFILLIYFIYKTYTSNINWERLLALVFGSISTIALVIMFFYIIYTGLFKEEEDKQTARFIAIAFIIWAIDLLPELPVIGKPYAGFEFDVMGTLNASWGSIMTSVK